MISDAKNCSNKLSAKTNKRIAIGWFGSEDFYEVCDLAGIEPKMIMRGNVMKIHNCKRSLNYSMSGERRSE